MAAGNLSNRALQRWKNVVAPLMEILGSLVIGAGIPFICTLHILNIITHFTHDPVPTLFKIETALLGQAPRRDTTISQRQGKEFILHWSFVFTILLPNFLVTNRNLSRQEVSEHSISICRIFYGKTAYLLKKAKRKTDFGSEDRVTLCDYLTTIHFLTAHYGIRWQMKSRFLIMLNYLVDHKNQVKDERDITAYIKLVEKHALDSLIDVIMVHRPYHGLTLQ